MGAAPLLAVVAGDPDTPTPPWVARLAARRVVHIAWVEASGTGGAGGVLEGLPPDLRRVPLHVVGIGPAASATLEIAARLGGTETPARSVALVDPTVDGTDGGGVPLVAVAARLFLSDRPEAAAGPDERLTFVAAFRRSPRVVALGAARDPAPLVEAWLEEREGENAPR